VYLAILGKYPIPILLWGWRLSRDLWQIAFCTIFKLNTNRCLEQKNILNRFLIIFVYFSSSFKLFFVCLYGFRVVQIWLFFLILQSKVFLCSIFCRLIKVFFSSLSVSVFVLLKYSLSLSFFLSLYVCLK
jgi:hypothetical protein